MYNKKSRRIFNFDVFCTPIKIHFQWMLSLLSPNDFLLIGSYRRRSWKHTRALHVLQQKKPGFRVFFSQNLFAFSIHLSIWKVLPDDIRKLHSSVKNDNWQILEKNPLILEQFTKCESIKKTFWVLTEKIDIFW